MSHIHAFYGQEVLWSRGSTLKNLIQSAKTCTLATFLKLQTSWRDSSSSLFPFLVPPAMVEPGRWRRRRGEGVQEEGGKEGTEITKLVLSQGFLQQRTNIVLSHQRLNPPSPAATETTSKGHCRKCHEKVTVTRQVYSSSRVKHIKKLASYKVSWGNFGNGVTPGILHLECCSFLER